MLALLTVAIGIGNLVFRAFVLKCYWAWFAVKLFPSLPTFNLPQCLALFFVFSVFIYPKTMTLKDYKESKESNKDPDSKYMGIANNAVVVMHTSVLLLMGYVFHLMF
jgi:hypothetical protein